MFLLDYPLHKQITFASNVHENDAASHTVHQSHCAHDMRNTRQTVVHLRARRNKTTIFVSCHNFFHVFRQLMTESSRISTVNTAAHAVHHLRMHQLTFWRQAWQCLCLAGVKKKRHRHVIMRMQVFFYQKMFFLEKVWLAVWACFSESAHCPPWRMWILTQMNVMFPPNDCVSQIK